MNAKTAHHATSQAAATSQAIFDVVAAQAFLARLWALDTLLVGRGFHAMSPWWREQIERFVHALPRRVRRAIVRAGRRAGKSSTLCRLLVAWALWGAWFVPAGDIAVIAFLSVSRDEAAARLRTIAAILDALGVPYDQRGEEIELLGERRVLFRVYSATTRAVGYTSIAIAADEVARWESRDTAANPAAEVFGSLFPTLASQPYGFALLVSSPWGSDDYHAERFDEGDNAHQLVSFAPTWVANPTISEERTHELEPDPRIWAREYAAEPSAVVTAALDPADLAACFRALPGDLCSHFISTDASSLRGDDWAFIEGGVTRAGEVVVLRGDGWGGDELRRVSMADVVAGVAARAHALGVSTVYGDQREEASLRSMFAEHEINFRSYAWSESSKDTAMQTLRRFMRDRRIVLAKHARLTVELSGLKARLVPSGRIRYETNGLDYASALITLMHAIDDKHLRVDEAGEPFIGVIGIGSDRSGRPGIHYYGSGRVSGDVDYAERARLRRLNFMKDRR